MENNYSCEEASIKLPNLNELRIKIKSRVQADPLLKLSDESAKLNGEETIQLLEGCSYDYQLPEKYFFKTIPGVVDQNSFDANKGTITPGNYVGRLSLSITTSENNIIERAVEVRSAKAGYRSDYRVMLQYIAEECTELLMIHSSPVTQTYSPDHKKESEVIYQKFAFVQSLSDSEDFRNAVQRVLSIPVTMWKQKKEEVDIRRSNRLTNSQIRQISSRQNRVSLPQTHSLRVQGILESVPSRITSTIQTDTVDTPENQFVKHVLTEFQSFFAKVRRIIETNINDPKKRPHIYSEAGRLEDQFSDYLNHNIFREISKPTALPLNSPVMQRKEGYREILRAWLMYDLIARLSWGALEDDGYHVGKRNVATLYEYWLFFKLLRLIEEIFEVKPKETKDLIIETEDKLGLRLKAGKHSAVTGKYIHKNRNLNIKFSYNRTFSNSDYPYGGSWTQPMRPDYTLSLWPEQFSENEAELKELVVHVHFDAKYKVDKSQYFSSEKQPNENESEDQLYKEKEDEKKGIYKNADLLKMHAYKDAIRRTVGAYVLYPGEKTIYKKGFHEIIPGLGAFAVSPSNDSECMKGVREFIYDVLDHYTNRASQREQLSYQYFDIHFNNKVEEINAKLPECVTGTNTRSTPPGNTTVLIGCYDKEEYAWIEKKQLYKVQINPKKGLKKFSPDIMGADYLLLHVRDELETSKIWEIVSTAPTLESKQFLKKMNYPIEPSCENYLMFKLRPVVNGSFGENKWDVSKIEGYEANSVSLRPFSATLTSLMKAVVRN